MEAEKAPEKIDLISYVNRFFKMLQKFWIYVLILAVLGAGLNYIRERRGFWPYYESKVIFSVRSGYAGDDVFTNPYYLPQYAQYGYHEGLGPGQAGQELHQRHHHPFQYRRYEPV